MPVCTYASFAIYCQARCRCRHAGLYMYIEYVAGLFMHVVWQAAYVMAQFHHITPLQVMAKAPGFASRVCVVLV